MIDFLWGVLAVLVVFGTVVVVHELGHFGAAKFFKIRVEAFSVGFGPRLFGFRRGETDYKVCAIPLGGYVKMAGENPDDVTGGVEEFLSHPKWQRFIVAVMGPVMNGCAGGGPADRTFLLPIRGSHLAPGIRGGGLDQVRLPCPQVRSQAG